MNRLLTLIFLLVTLSALNLCGEVSFAADGVIMEQERYQKGNSTKERGKIWISDNKIKFEEGSGRAAAIFNLNTGEMIQIDKQGKRYVSAKPEEYFKFIQELTLKMKSEMEKQLSQLPPDKRAEMEQMMKSQGMTLPGNHPKPKSLTLQKTNKDQKIAGYASLKYEIYEDGKLKDAIWTSSDVVKGEIDIEKLSNYLEDIKDISESATGTVYDSEGQRIYKEVFQSGFPMKTVGYESDGNIYIEEIVNVSKANVAETEFIPPQGFKKISLQEMMTQFGN